MIIEPKVRGPVCLTVHPSGCAEHVRRQIEHARARPFLSRPAPAGRPRKALVIGASTGFGLATRITAAFGGGADTVGVFHERPAGGRRTASAGWYNSAFFEQEARRTALGAWSVNGDAFSAQVRGETLRLLGRRTGPVDLVVYSLAAPRRADPATGQVYVSALKPIGRSYTNKTLNFHTGEVYPLTAPPAADEEIHGTVAVMGGEDWKLWIDALREAGLLAPGAITVAYSYIGSELTRPIYRDGTIGRAKEHLEATARSLDTGLAALGGRALVSVNKAVVTLASAAIPFVPLYISLLYRVMKEAGTHEGCIEQMDRLFRERLYTGGPVPVDDEGRIRLDDREQDPRVQAEVRERWERADSGNVAGLADLAGYREEFSRICGFGFPQVDYRADVDPRVDVPSLAGPDLSQASWKNRSISEADEW
jgi:enoyl-[acyl-carrier protein] reductase/trans-2-enoyl-CoA reductase (NAD+)